MTSGSLTTSSASDFPAANLGPSALAWARAVMQRIAQLEDAERVDASKILGLNKTLIQVLRKAGSFPGAIYTADGIVVPRADQEFADQTVWGMQRLQSINNRTANFDTAVNIGSPNNFGLDLHGFSDGYAGLQLHHDTPAVQRAFGNVLYLNNSNVRMQEVLDDAVTTSWLEAGLDGDGWPFLYLLDDQMANVFTDGGYQFKIERLGGSAGEWVLKILDETLHNGWYSDLVAKTQQSLPTTATSGQFLTWNGTAWVAADLPAGSGGSADGNALTEYRGDWVPTPPPPAAGSGATGFLAPDATVDFSAGVVPAWVVPTLAGGAVSIVPNSDTTLLTGAAGTESLKLQGDTGVDYLEFQVDSTGDAYLDVEWAYDLGPNVQVQMTVDGQNVAAASGTAEVQQALTDAQVPQAWGYFATPGKHTVRIALDATAAAGATGAVWVNTVAAHGSTPSGDSPGANISLGTAPSPYTSYAASDLVRYDGDVWLARQATDNEATPADGSVWARLSTHGATALSELTDVDESSGPSAGQTLTWNGTKWAPATPAAGGSGGSAAAMSTTTPPTNSTTGWTRNAAFGTLTSDGTVLVLTSTSASQFVRYYYGTTPIPAPINLATTEITFDIFIPATGAAGMSAGIDLSAAGAAGYFDVRVDVASDGVTCGLRFEQDGTANVASVASVPQLSVGAWHTIRFVRHGASAIAFVDGVRVLGTDGGPTSIGNQVTLILFGGSASGAVAKYRNIVVKTYGDPEAAVTAVTPQAVFPFTTAAAQWTINHGFGRIPAVTTYDAAGAHNLAEFTATSTQVVVTWANPTAGTAVLS